MRQVLNVMRQFTYVREQGLPLPGTVHPVKGTALLLALVTALLLFRLGEAPLVGPDEPRYVRVAVEMHRRGDWIVPTLQGQPWLEKPALYYWMAGAAFSLFGETETAARLPSVLAAIVLTGVTALVGARLYGGGAGLHAGFLAGTSLLVFAYGRAAAMDMLLAATVSAAITEGRRAAVSVSPNRENAAPAIQ